jgi:hypothetical protein
MQRLAVSRTVLERERHHAVGDALAVDTRDAFQKSHAAAQSHDERLDLDDITRAHGTTIADLLDAGEVDQALAIFRLRKNHDGADLRNCLGENRWWKDGRAVRLPGEITFVQRNVLDANDPLIEFELGDAIDEQKRIAMGKNLLDGGIIERQREIHGEIILVARPRDTIDE